MTLQLIPQDRAQREREASRWADFAADYPAIARWVNENPENWRAAHIRDDVERAPLTKERLKKYYTLVLTHMKERR